MTNQKTKPTCADCVGCEVESEICQSFISRHKRPTNYERIKAMSEEELASFLREQWWCCFCPCLDVSVSRLERPDCMHHDCIEPITRWLKAESE